MADPIIKITVDDNELDSALEKAERLKKLLKEARTLAYELCHKSINVSIDSKQINMPEFLSECKKGVKGHGPDHKKC